MVDDNAIEETINGLVNDICSEGTNNETVEKSINELTESLKSSFGTVTTVPKQLKFLRRHYDKLKIAYGKFPFGPFADLLSLLAMTYSTEGSTDVLGYKMKGNLDDFSQWGHEFVRHLALEVMYLYATEKSENKDTSLLVTLAQKIVKFQFEHNAEPYACDLANGTNQLNIIIPYCTRDNHHRVALYLRGIAEMQNDSAAKRLIMKVILDIQTSLNLRVQALETCIRMNDRELARNIYSQIDIDKNEKLQMSYLLGRHRYFLFTEDERAGNIEDEDLYTALSNQNSSKFYRYVARELNISDPKKPDDIFKGNVQHQAATITSSANNLSTTFASAFANAAHGSEALVSADANWIHKHKDHRMISAVASVGLVHMWDPDEGLNVMDKYLYSNENYVKAGANLGFGLVACGTFDVRVDAAYALLEENVINKPREIRLSSILGLALAYAGTEHTKVQDLLTPILADAQEDGIVAAFCSLALGLVFAGTANENAAEAILLTIIERTKFYNDSTFILLALGLGFLFLGRKEDADIMSQALEVVKDAAPKTGLLCKQILRICAFAGSGNVEIVHECIKLCAEKTEADKPQGEGAAAPPAEKSDKEDNATHQAVACIGIGLIAFAEPLGAEMARRSLEHILQYGEPVVRRAVPLALALLSLSNPQMVITDTLSKLSHDGDEVTCMNAVLSLGLVASGTNNARIANMLRTLGNSFAKDANLSFLVRSSQGILSLGKGILTLSPLTLDRSAVDYVSLAAVLGLIIPALNIKNLLLGEYHYLYFILAPAMTPRYFHTITPDGNPITTSVRVGQAVDIVAVPGKPKTITGFQTHKTPVLLSAGDRAELAGDGTSSISPTLEGVCLTIQKAKEEELSP